MKSIKIYLIVVCALFLLALAAVVYVWLSIQNLSTDVEEAVTGNGMEETVQVPESETEITPAVANEEEVVAPIEKEPEAIIIKTETLPEAQQETLDTFGLDAEAYTITPEMVACANKKIGEERVAEIVAGSSPSPIEALSLLPCVNQ